MKQPLVHHRDEMQPIDWPAIPHQRANLGPGTQLLELGSDQGCVHVSQDTGDGEVIRWPTREHQKRNHACRNRQACSEMRWCAGSFRYLGHSLCCFPLDVFFIGGPVTRLVRRGKIMGCNPQNVLHGLEPPMSRFAISFVLAAGILLGNAVAAEDATPVKLPLPAFRITRRRTPQFVSSPLAGEYFRLRGHVGEDGESPDPRRLPARASG
jgi:hypothetical protein